MDIQVTAGAPITFAFAGLFGLIAGVLTIWVGTKRGKYQVSIGDGGERELLRATRVFGNYIEYVPLTLVLMGLCELSGIQNWVLYAAGGSLLAGRLLHIQGLHAEKLTTFGRAAGMVLTLLSVVGLSGIGLYSFFA